MGWEELEMNNWQRVDAQKVVRKMEARKTEIAIGDLINSDLERVREEWRKKSNRRNWKLRTENVVRDK